MGDDNSEGMLEKKRMWSGLRTQIGEILFYWLKRGDFEIILGRKTNLFKKFQK
jgi:hypothetical protein